MPDSGGVWAPALSHADGLFRLVYSDAKSLNGPFKDVRNYLATAERAEGPWSDPVALNSGGFDPSLFHGDDGRRCLRLLAADNRRLTGILADPVPIAAKGAVELSASLSGGKLQFQASWGSKAMAIGPELDATTLSDDYPTEGGAGWSFTGPFAALCAQDSGDSGIPADFDWFRYRSR